MVLQYTRSGALVPPAKLHKRWSEDFESGVLPWWLTPGASANDAGSSRAWLDKSTTRGGIQLITAATASARSTVIGPAIDLSLCTAVALRVQFTGVFPAGQSSLVIGCYNDIASPTLGFAFRKLSNQASSQLVAYRKTTSNAAVNVSDSLSFESLADTVKTFDLRLILDVPERTITFAENEDQVRTTWKPGVAANVTDPLALGVVTPFVRIVAADAVARSMIVHRFEVDRWMK